MKRNEIESNLLFVFLLVAIGILVTYVISLYQPQNTMSRDTLEYTSSLSEIQSNVGVWFWQDISTYSYEAIVTQLAQYQRAHITDVYLNVEWLLNIKEAPLSPQQKNQRYLQFTQALNHYVSVANAYGIKVHGLAGGPEWVMDTHSYIPAAILAIVLEYNQENPNQRLAGIQFDIEFHNAAGFSTHARTYSESFLRITQNLRSTIAAYDDTFKLGFAIPYWFDGDNDNIDKFTYSGKSNYLTFHLIDLLSKPSEYIVIMAYRDRVYGSNGILELTESERSYLTENQRALELLIGIETTQTDERNVSFYGTTRDYLIESMINIEEEIRDLPNYGGIVVHEANSYLTIIDGDVN